MISVASALIDFLKFRIVADLLFGQQRMPLMVLDAESNT